MWNNPKYAHRVLLEKSEGKRPLGKPRRKWEDNIKMYVKEMDCDTGNWMDLAQGQDKCAYVKAVMNFRIP